MTPDQEKAIGMIAESFAATRAMLDQLPVYGFVFAWPTGLALKFEGTPTHPENVKVVGLMYATVMPSRPLRYREIFNGADERAQLMSVADARAMAIETQDKAIEGFLSTIRRSAEGGLL